MKTNQGRLFLLFYRGEKQNKLAELLEQVEEEQVNKQFSCHIMNVIYTMDSNIRIHSQT